MISGNQPILTHTRTYDFRTTVLNAKFMTKWHLKVDRFDFYSIHTIARYSYSYYVSPCTQSMCFASWPHFGMSNKLHGLLWYVLATWWWYRKLRINIRRCQTWATPINTSMQLQFYQHGLFVISTCISKHIPPKITYQFQNINCCTRIHHQVKKVGQILKLL